VVGYDQVKGERDKRVKEAKKDGRKGSSHPPFGIHKIPPAVTDQTHRSPPTLTGF
tara:strand:- start:175 stop:339 length:165 start_codon:yes stop_codon:yes gene_type:complete